ncbi:MAG: hypothetical protein ACTSVZ_12615 [Promethearchaeota archaeon]
MSRFPIIGVKVEKKRGASQPFTRDSDFSDVCEKPSSWARVCLSAIDFESALV